MDSETTFKVGDRVRVLRVQADSEGIPEMEGMVGGTYAVEDLTAESAVLDGWYFNFSALQLIEHDGKRVDKDVNTSQQVCQGLSRRDQFAMAAMRALVQVEEAQGWSDDNSTTMLPNEVADHAIAYADALIAALDAGEAGND